MKTTAQTFSLVLNAVLLLLVIWLAADRNRAVDAEPVGGNDAAGEETANGEPATAKTIISIQPSAQFSALDQVQLREKMITPFIDYNTCMGAAPVSIMIKPSNTGGYRYIVEALFPPSSAGSDMAVYNGFLYGTSSDEQPYWVPDLIMTECVDTLPNADDVRDQAVDEYNG